MATDDPGTPGDGHWEINLGAIGTHTRSAWTVDAPDADINYGLGDHIQLNLDLPWAYTDADGRWRSGVGDTSVAVKWRFLDAEDAHGLELSTYPRYQTSLSNYSERIGVASPNAEFFLPIEAAIKVGGLELAADLGRHFVQHEDSYWSAGIVAGHACGAVECLAEIHREWRPGGAQTLANLGLRWKLTENLTLLGAAGREFGHASTDQVRALIYLGLQISR
jgi:hypothetical protein